MSGLTATVVGGSYAILKVPNGPYQSTTDAFQRWWGPKTTAAPRPTTVLQSSGDYVVIQLDSRSQLYTVESLRNGAVTGIVQFTTLSNDVQQASGITISPSTGTTHIRTAIFGYSGDGITPETAVAYFNGWAGTTAYPVNGQFNSKGTTGLQGGTNTVSLVTYAPGNISAEASSGITFSLGTLRSESKYFTLWVDYVPSAVTNATATINGNIVNLSWSLPGGEDMTPTVVYWPVGNTGQSVTKTYPNASTLAQLNVAESGTYAFDIFAGNGSAAHATGTFSVGASAAPANVTQILASGKGGLISLTVAVDSGWMDKLNVTAVGTSGTTGSTSMSVSTTSSITSSKIKLPSIGTYTLTVTPSSSTYGSGNGMTTLVYWPADVTMMDVVDSTLTWSLGEGPADSVMILMQGPDTVNYVRSDSTSYPVPDSAFGATISINSTVARMYDTFYGTTRYGTWDIESTPSVTNLSAQLDTDTVSLSWGYTGATPTSASLSWTGALVGNASVGTGTSYSMTVVP